MSGIGEIPEGMEAAEEAATGAESSAAKEEENVVPPQDKKIEEVEDERREAARQSTRKFRQRNQFSGTKQEWDYPSKRNRKLTEYIDIGGTGGQKSTPQAVDLLKTIQQTLLGLRGDTQDVKDSIISERTDILSSLGGVNESLKDLLAFGIHSPNNSTPTNEPKKEKKPKGSLMTALITAGVMEGLHLLGIALTDAQKEWTKISGLFKDGERAVGDAIHGIENFVAPYIKKAEHAAEKANQAVQHGANWVDRNVLGLPQQATIHGDRDLSDETSAFTAQLEGKNIDSAATLGQHVQDPGGGVSYGFLGMNSKAGMIQKFVKEHPELGLTAEVDSKEFFKQWEDAAFYKKDEMKKAQQDFYFKNEYSKARAFLEGTNLPDDLKIDRGIIAYFTDLIVQRGVSKDTLNSRINKAMKEHPVDLNNPKAFLRDLEKEDESNIDVDFKKAIGTFSKTHSEEKTERYREALLGRERNRLNDAILVEDDPSRGITTKLDPSFSKTAQQNRALTENAPSGKPEVVVVTAPASSSPKQAPMPNPTLHSSLSQHPGLAGNVPSPSAEATAYDYEGYWNVNQNSPV